MAYHVEVELCFRICGVHAVTVTINSNFSVSGTFILHVATMLVSEDNITFNDPTI